MCYVCLLPCVFLLVFPCTSCSVSVLSVSPVCAGWAWLTYFFNHSLIAPHLLSFHTCLSSSDQPPAVFNSGSPFQTLPVRRCTLRGNFPYQLQKNFLIIPCCGCFFDSCLFLTLPLFSLQSCHTHLPCSPRSACPRLLPRPRRPALEFFPLDFPCLVCLCPFWNDGMQDKPAIYTHSRDRREPVWQLHLPNWRPMFGSCSCHTPPEWLLLYVGLSWVPWLLVHHWCAAPPSPRVQSVWPGEAVNQLSTTHTLILVHNLYFLVLVLVLVDILN